MCDYLILNSKQITQSASGFKTFNKCVLKVVGCGTTIGKDPFK